MTRSQIEAPATPIVPTSSTIPVVSNGQGSIRCNDISLRLGGQWILSRLSFVLPEAEITLLSGENGAGKTTLLRVLASLVKPTRGEVFWYSQALNTSSDKLRIRRNIEFLTHQHFFYDALTASQNLTLVARLAGITADVAPLLKRVALHEHADRSVGVFSAGMKKRLCFARLLLLKPKLILLDEPFAQVDVEGIALLQTLIDELQQGGASIILCTHNIKRGSEIATHHIELEGGFLRYAGPIRCRKGALV